MEFLSIFQDRYTNLNEQQKLAVDSIDGPVLVVAGPGSGKTELLSLRVANILKNTDTLPSSILCLTFTDAAAANMRNRLAGLIGKEAYKVAIHTFHSFGTEIIGQNPQYFYRGAVYKPADKIIQVEIIEKILKKLDHKSQLSSYHPKQGFTFMNGIMSNIANLKKGGLSPEKFEEIMLKNQKYLQIVNPLIIGCFSDRVSKKMMPKISALINEMQMSGENPPIKEILINSLQEMLAEAEDIEKTTPITNWKKKYTKQNTKKETCLKDYINSKKHLELASVYQKYQELLHDAGYFDYADMILDVTKAMQDYPDLKYNVQEQYQYVLVDEFQDTNGAQMDLLESVLDAQVNERRPNVLAVGDDDQAIYKFQGANLSNIMEFKEKYRDPKIITLINNYRSTQEILDTIRPVILKGNERLETKYNIKKELFASNKNLKTGQIALNQFENQISELTWIAEQIKKNINNAEDLGEIAVIMRKHKELELAASIFKQLGIPFIYEKRENILEQEHIMQLITIVRYVNSLLNSNTHVASELLPQILSYKFLNISAIDVWHISIKARKEKLEWLEIMKDHEKPNIQLIANFFITLGVQAMSKTAEEIIDKITGIKAVMIEETEFFSPYKEFYFGKDQLTNNKNGYIEYLSSLKALINAIRERKSHAAIYTQDIVDLIDLHEKHKIKLENSNKFIKSESSVNLLTAHSSKGLEFKTVYLPGCQEQNWQKAGGRSLLSLSSDLPLAPDKDNEDDNLRLLYVVMSRAKENLHISYHKINDNAKEQNLLRFLIDELPITELNPQISTDDQLEISLGLKPVAQMTGEQQDLLKDLLNDYRLNITHLNNFLDIENAGPEFFLEHNLLHFPQQQSSSAAYGSAVHDTLENLLNIYRKRKEKPTFTELIKIFEQSLLSQRLNKEDFEKQFKRGEDELKSYLDHRMDSFDLTDLPEANFREQGVVVEQVALTGKIDRMKVDQVNKKITVIDYKTGKPIKSWSDSNKIKIWKLENQLIFYKILVENSRSYGDKYKVDTAMLEFIRPTVDGETISLSYTITPDAIDRMKKLTKAVSNKIQSLDFPDISKYKKDITGIRQFEEDLINGII